MILNEDIVDIGKPGGIYLFIFVLDEFSGLFLHPPIFSIICINNKWCFIRLMMLVKF